MRPSYLEWRECSQGFAGQRASREQRSSTRSTPLESTAANSPHGLAGAIPRRCQPNLKEVSPGERRELSRWSYPLPFALLHGWWEHFADSIFGSLDRTYYSHFSSIRKSLSAFRISPWFFAFFAGPLFANPLQKCWPEVSDEQTYFSRLGCGGIFASV